ncbi:MAG: hypothetical protein Q4F28_15865, partial [Eubacteriales bacterium]|nr:hypothetical protein [Eubacteriales bacterium]
MMRKMPFNRAGKAAVLLALSGCMMLGVVSPAAADVRSEEAKQEAAAIAQARRDSAQVQSLMQTDQGGTPTKILSQESTAPEKNVTMTAKNPAGQMVQQTYSKVVTTTSRRKSSDDDDDDEDDKKKENYDTSRGPGARAQDVKLEVRDSEGVTGPQVLEIQMSETYHEDYDVYTQSIEGRFFIYTNVSNNGITDQPVYLDIPGNVSYRAEKDGVPMAYTTKQKVSEMGTYLFYFTAVKDSSKPLAEQIIYETTFNFRIQPKVVRETAAGNSGEGADRYGQEPLPWSYTDVTGDGEVPADGSGAGEVPVNGTWDGAAAGSGTEDGAADGIGTGDGTA